VKDEPGGPRIGLHATWPPSPRIPRLRPNFLPGRNIALKIPPHDYEATLRFYRDVLGLSPLENHPPHVGFGVGGKRLRIDHVPGLSQAEVWLEVVTDDVDAAAAHLQAHGVVRCDEIEPLPPGHQGFWIMDPTSLVIHLGSRDEGW
jgi:catechol 2,3-dioxygenase-like lactoylglutathione lyase family enzyme